MSSLIRTIEVTGIIAFALTGIYEARKKAMDIVGVYAVAGLARAELPEHDLLRSDRCDCCTDRSPSAAIRRRRQDSRLPKSRGER